MREQPALIWADGLCEPRNPGGIATYGYLVRFPDGTEQEGWSVVALGGPESTNNRAEYTAVLKALEALAARGYTGPVEVRSDSQLLIRQLQGVYAVQSPRIRPLYQQVRALARRFARVVWIWVPREENQRADALSRRAYQEALAEAARARAQGLAVEALGDSRFRVASSRGTGWYEVTVEPETCTCPAFARGFRPCKHLIAAKEGTEVRRPLRREVARRFVESLPVRPMAWQVSGSVARGEDRPESDLDLDVLFATREEETLVFEQVVLPHGPAFLIPFEGERIDLHAFYLEGHPAREAVLAIFSLQNQSPRIRPKRDLCG